jgi:hypothetical protein
MMCEKEEGAGGRQCRELELEERKRRLGEEKGKQTLANFRSYRFVLCVSSVDFQGRRTKPLAGPIRRAPKGRLPGHPPVVPHPESLAAQAAYRGRHSTIVIYMGNSAEI